MKKYLAKALGLTLALSTVMAVPTQAEPFVIHDLTGEGRIDSEDAKIALNEALKNPNATEIKYTYKGKTLERPVNFAYVDLDDDGRVTANDAALYRQDGSITVNINITSGSGKTENYKVAALKSDNVLSLYEAKFKAEDPDFKEFIKNYLEKIQNKAERTTFTVGGKSYSFFDAEGHQAIADEINNIAGYKGKFSTNAFKKLMPNSKSEITEEYLRDFPRAFAMCFAEDVRDNKDFAKAAADKLRSYSDEHGNRNIELTYIGSDGKEHTEISSRKVAADLIEQFAYMSLTVNDVATAYGNHASLKYNGYTIVLDIEK